MTEEVAPQPVTIVEPSSPSMEDTMSAVFDKINPPREETGQFKSKNTEAAPVEKTEAAPEVSAQEPPKASSEPEPSAPVIEMPAAWAADRKQLWDSASPELKQYMLERETQSGNRLSELGRTAKETERYRELFTRHQHALEGAQPDQVIESLLATKSAFLRDPVGTYIQLGQQLGINPSQLVQQAQPNNADPIQQYIDQRLAPVERRLSETQRQFDARVQADKQARTQALQEQIEKFSEGKDYWPDVESEVESQIYAIKLKDPARADNDPIGVLKEAHDRAIKLVPAVQEKLQAKEKAEAEKKAAEEAKKKAAEAKRDASLNVRSNAGKTPTNTSTDIWSNDSWSSAYDKAQARG